MEHTVKIGRIIKHNGIWVIFPFALILGFQFIIPEPPQASIMLPLLFVLFCFFSIIPLIIHFNFWSLDKNLLLLVDDHHLIIKNQRTGFTFRIDHDHIEEIEITTCSSSRAFWGMNEYSKIVTKQNGHLHLTNYLVEPSDLQEKLQSVVKFNIRQEFIPLIATRELGYEDKVLRA